MFNYIKQWLWIELKGDSILKARAIEWYIYIRKIDRWNKYGQDQGDKSGYQCNQKDKGEDKHDVEHWHRHQTADADKDGNNDG